MHTVNRDIPASTAISIILGRGVTIIGWIAFSFFMIFAWSFGGSADTSFIHFRGEINTTKGYVIEVVETNMAINDRSVWANVYTYADAQGNEYVRDAFTTGRPLRQDQNVTVKYPTNAPEYGRIPGTRSAAFGSWMLLMFALPLIGLGMAFYGISRGLKDYRILKVGKIAKAKLIEKSATNTVINDRRVYKLTFEFHTEDGTDHFKTLKTHLTDRFEDDEFERLFYDPSDPSKSTLADDVAGAPDIDQHSGQVTINAKLPIAPIFWLVICITPHIWYSTTLI